MNLLYSLIWCRGEVTHDEPLFNKWEAEWPTV